MSYREDIEKRGYTKEGLSENDKAFIEGMEFVLKEVVTQNFFSEDDFYEIKEFSPTLAKISEELNHSAKDCVRAMIECSIADMLTSLHEEEIK